MATSSDGITHNADGTYSRNGKVISANGKPVTSLGQARTALGLSTPTATKGGSTSGSNPYAVPSNAFTNASASYQADNQQLAPQTQFATNAENADINNPFGGQSTTVDSNGKAITNYTLSQGNQNVVNGLQGNAGTAGGNLENILHSGIFNGWSGASTPGQAAANDPYTSAVYGQLTQNLDTQKSQDTAALQQQLVNRGIPIGSDEYNKEMNNLQNQYQNYYSNAANQAVTSGAGIQNQAASTLQGINSQGYIAPNWQQTISGFNPNLQTNATQVGQVFGQLTNQGKAAQAALEQAKASLQNAGTASSQAGFQDALTSFLLGGGANQAGNVTQSGNGVGIPTS